MQAEVLFLVNLLGTDDPAHELLYLWNEPDEDSGVGHVETGMEGGQHKAQFGGIGQKSLGTGGGAVHGDIVAD